MLGNALDDAGQRALIEKYLEFKLLMLKIDPAEEGDEEAEERLAVAMRTYQVSESPTPAEVPPVTALMGVPVTQAATCPPPLPPPGHHHQHAATTPSKRGTKPRGAPRSPRSDSKSASAKKKPAHRKRKRRLDSDESSDDSDCDPDFRA